MTSKGEFIRKTVRAIAIAYVSTVFGSLVALLLKVSLDIELPKLVTSAITFAFAAFSAFYLFPKVMQFPFRDLAWSEYMRRLGLYLPHKAWKHVLLGTLLAACTLSGMWFGSLLLGGYEPDWSTVNLSHTLFSINPGLWEELFFRGVIMFVLLKVTKSLKRAALIQIVLFGLAHIKGFDLWAWVDVGSVLILAVAFTYTAYKTRTLVAGIVFHFLHDTFLFLPQLPGKEYTGVTENLVFYATLWLMAGVACMLVKLSADRLGVKAKADLYNLEQASSA